MLTNGESGSGEFRWKLRLGIPTEVERFFEGIGRSPNENDLG